jgi:hypothetical protein
VSVTRTTETFRLLYHARLLIVAAVGVVGVLGIVAYSRGQIGQSEIGAGAFVLLGAALAVLGFIGWLGFIDYASASVLAIDARGVRVGGRSVAWADVRALSRGTGALRLALRTDAGIVRFQLLVHAEPIRALKLLVSESTKAGAAVDPYLARLAEYVEEEE